MACALLQFSSALGSYLFSLTAGETEAHRVSAVCPRSLKDVNERPRSEVQTPLHPMSFLVLFVAFPKIGPARETEAPYWVFLGVGVGEALV